MSKFFHSFISALSILILISCSDSKQELAKAFSDWDTDPNACIGIRSELAGELIEKKDLILDLNENQVLEIFGRPDKTKLLKRSQKEFIYFIESSPECENNSARSKYLWIRIAAISNVSEVLILEE